ncbi:hypothetical protein SDJN02_19660 [Cucurbita argyrosperma subsp. argyrosperma]|nr:hypothetical protein SDJN02_19660 [Cucurbita argyrosperma subsp. argyrosperma]
MLAIDITTHPWLLPNPGSISGKAQPPRQPRRRRKTIANLQENSQTRQEPTAAAGNIRRQVLTSQGRIKLNAYPDREFYAFPRFVTHVDNGFISTLTNLYRERLRPGIEVLDLMSSWVSHLPKEVEYKRVVGHGLNAQELAKNSQLDYFFVKDLNEDQKLELESCSIDAVVCTVSVQYLQQPEKDPVSSQAHRPVSTSLRSPTSSLAHYLVSIPLRSLASLLIHHSILSLKVFKMRLLRRGFHALIKNALFPSPTNVGSHNPPPFGSSVLVGTPSGVHSPFGLNVLAGTPPSVLTLIPFVFAEVFRVLRPGGVFIISFSNRMFYEKAVSAWREGSAYSRVQLVVQYFQCIEGFTQPEIIRKMPASSSTGEDNSPFSWILRLLGLFSGSDPFYAVLAHKNFKPVYTNETS